MEIDTEIIDLLTKLGDANADKTTGIYPVDKFTWVDERLLKY